MIVAGDSVSMSYLAMTPFTWIGMNTVGSRCVSGVSSCFHSVQSSSCLYSSSKFCFLKLLLQLSHPLFCSFLVQLCLWPHIAHCPASMSFLLLSCRLAISAGTCQMSFKPTLETPFAPILAALCWVEATLFLLWHIWFGCLQ